jgi:hypothetical protein
MMKNTDKLKEKAEMAIQAKGWLSNIVRVLYTVRHQKIWMTWMSFFIVDLWISLLFGVVSQNYKTLSQARKTIKSYDGDFSNTRMFLGVPFEQ